MRAVLVELSKRRLFVWRVENWLMTSMMYNLMEFQQALKKALKKPSGPDSLSLAILSTAALTSSSLKDASRSARSQYGRVMC
jgi:hypothetical protein